jgi:phosphoribosyl 1,2-cyclic phosphodiesterase
MTIQFAVLSSGSRGNSSLIQAGHAGLLIDLGLGPKTLASRLGGVGSSVARIGAAVLTHTHGDHVQDSTIRLLARGKVPLYCHEGHRLGLADWPAFRELDRLGLVRHYDERPFLTPLGMRIEPVELSHDGGPTFGFRVEGRGERGRRPASVGYLADTGCWSDAMADAMTDVDALGVEFNHDVTLQLNSGRSPHLIRRNLGDRGHLSNDQGAGLVSAILGRSGPGTVRDLVLLHLSEQCNHPKLALASAQAAARASGRRVVIHPAGQTQAFPNLQVKAGRRLRRTVTPGPVLFPWEAD